MSQTEAIDTVKVQIDETAEPSEPIVPSLWFGKKFPMLAKQHGTAVLEELKNDILTVKAINEDFFAAVLGEEGRPGEPTVYVPAEAKFYTYSPTDGVYVPASEPLLTSHVSSLLLEGARACRKGCNTSALAFRFRKNASISGILRKARGLLAAPPSFFDGQTTEYIACANGMLRLKDRALLPFGPSYRRRNKLAVPFDPSAKCPLFLDKLMRAALDDQDLDLIQRWCGLALLGENLAQRLMILTGTPGGGKGTFINVLTGIIGETNLATLRTTQLGERFELGRFMGKTLLYGADVPDNFLSHRGASTIKSLTGGDPVTLEFKGSNDCPVITCRFNVIVTCNSRLMVHLEGDVEAWRRRLAIIAYQRPKPKEVIPDLARRILTTERSGVLNWFLEGLDKLRADSYLLNLTESQQARVDKLLLESESHLVFVREALTTQPGGQLSVPDCYAAYLEFCSQRGWTAMPERKFGSVINDAVIGKWSKALRNDILDTNGKSQRGWKGLALARNFSQRSESLPPKIDDTILHYFIRELKEADISLNSLSTLSDGGHVALPVDLPTDQQKESVGRLAPDTSDAL